MPTVSVRIEQLFEYITTSNECTKRRSVTIYLTGNQLFKSIELTVRTRNWF
jgi:hypothetical protein